VVHGAIRTGQDKSRQQQYEHDPAYSLQHRPCTGKGIVIEAR